MKFSFETVSKQDESFRLTHFVVFEGLSLSSLYVLANSKPLLRQTYRRLINYCRRDHDFIVHKNIQIIFISELLECKSKFWVCGFPVSSCVSSGY